MQLCPGLLRRGLGTESMTSGVWNWLVKGSVRLPFLSSRNPRVCAVLIKDRVIEPTRSSLPNLYLAAQLCKSLPTRIGGPP